MKACDNSPNLDWWSCDVFTRCCNEFAEKLGIGSNNLAVTGSSSRAAASSTRLLFVAIEATWCSARKPPRTCLTKVTRALLFQHPSISQDTTINNNSVNDPFHFARLPWRTPRSRTRGTTRRRWTAIRRSIHWICACRSSAVKYSLATFRFSSIHLHIGINNAMWCVYLCAYNLDSPDPLCSRVVVR